ncbi:hypothetical protein H072_4973 [Dactylellina haptotyla CBS 200.50]|uniref:Insecticide toxin TcdB middle/N-terminal domain-containing protein n=1 Tax=Dactylellina haptotyla (strain CBS 200.50) TaxID=1284197 RepID=S8BNN3_DACHA|nr:hypothetical protein H072_4973 [Dactylellina haptotyla CBS 200.50]
MEREKGKLSAGSTGGQNFASTGNNNPEGERGSSNSATNGNPGKESRFNQFSEKFQLPSITQPTGGGSSRSINGSHQVNGYNGTLSWSATIPVTGASRWGAPALSLVYNSGSGNGPFGVGWSMSGLSRISRSTQPNLPMYTEDDIFNIDGTEMVAATELKLQDNGWSVQRYISRVGNIGPRIERWSSGSDMYWKVYSGGGITSIYGRDSESRIANGERVFSWLISEAYDNFGSFQKVIFKREDEKGVDLLQCHEIGRTTETRQTQLYPKSILYGNKTPFEITPTDDPKQLGNLKDLEFCYEVRLDYGDEGKDWPVRADVHSTYNAGFEIRTYRLCRRILMYHHFKEIQADALVSSFDLIYEEDKTLSRIISVQATGYSADGNSQTMPPSEFQYTDRPTRQKLRKSRFEPFDETSSANLAGMLAAGYEWVDIDGDGLSGLLACLEGSFYYKKLSIEDNKPILKPITQLDSIPNITGGVFTDINGDGQAEYVLDTAMQPGFYPRTSKNNERFDNFKPFESRTNIDVDRTRSSSHLDLTGDGLADLLVEDQDALAWYRSLGVKGYDEAKRGNIPRDLPNFSQADSSVGVFFADMTGDGLSDIVYIRDAIVSYWPNLGYGNFGSKVVMDNFLFLDRNELFDSSRVKFADIDGSGTADIIYTSSVGKVKVYFNQSGNAWDKPVTLKGAVPFMNSDTRITVADIFGSGTTCLVWSHTGYSGDSLPQLMYCDVMGGVKPHLMKSIKNNLGCEIEVNYLPSTRYYLQDEREGTPWITSLPFPVQCVSSVKSVERVSGESSVVSYRYHHGYYDKPEREFRGFGMVEISDTESTATALVDDLPPIHSKTWYHTGAFQDAREQRQRFSTEYFSQAVVPEDVVLDEEKLTADELVEAAAALKGSVLHTEVYSDDAAPEANIPYQVSNSRYSVRMLHPKDGDKRAAFQVFPLESVEYNYERNLLDPRIARTVNNVDTYGNILQTAVLLEGRRDSPLTGNDKADQMRSYITYTINEFTQLVDNENGYLVPITCRGSDYEVRGVADLTGFPDIPDEEIKYHDEADDTKPTKRLLSQFEVIYKKNDLTGYLPYGVAESMGIMGQAFELCYTDEMFDLYNKDGTHLIDKDKDLVKSGYVRRDGAWWVPTAELFYSTSQTPELDAAKKSFFTCVKHKDPLGAITLAEFDQYWLFTTKKVDALGNNGLGVFDYWTGSLKEVEDQNGNKTIFAYDSLGRLVGQASVGKGEGDSLDNFQVNLTQKDIDDFISNPEKTALLGTASQRTVYDDFSYFQKGAQFPNWSATIFALTHKGGPERLSNITFSYTDGSDRDIQVKEQTDDGKWRTNGWIVYNSKNLPIHQYEPFISETHQYEAENIVGYTSTLIYDPVGRNIATIFPDGSWVRTIRNPWETRIYDQNDLLLSNPEQELGIKLKDFKSWFDQATAKGGRYKAVADKTKNHADTPTIQYLDARATIILNIADGKDFKIEGRSKHDIQGYLLSSDDALGRTAMTSIYDMRGRTIMTSGMGIGRRWTFLDIFNNLHQTWDERGNHFTHEFDLLNRSTKVWLGETLITSVEYGEDQPDPTSKNLRGKPYLTHEQCGISLSDSYDFKGNCLHKSEQYVVKYATTTDWSHNVPLESEIFEASSTFDALNRPVLVKYSGSNYQNAVEYAYGRSGAKSVTNAGDTVFVKDIEYDQFNRVSRIQYGNGSVLTNEYDPVTGRLNRKSVTLNGKTKLDLQYIYDPIGNVVFTLRPTEDRKFFKNKIVDPVNEYTYDALYRLISASGREHLGQTKGRPTSENDPADTNFGVADTNPFANYTETYQYDLANNILDLSHTIDDDTSPGWKKHFTYVNNQLVRVEGAGVVTENYQYDLHGNTIKMPDLESMEWNFQDALVSTVCQRRNEGTPETVRYSYSSEGTRTRKVIERQGDGVKIRDHFYVSGNDIFRKYDSNGNILLQSAELHVSLDGEVIAIVENWSGPDRTSKGLPEQMIRFQFGERSQSITLELDENGEQISYEEYAPYGQTVYVSQVQEKRYRYAGKERDKETGLYYFNQRYYCSNMYRWLSSDPLGIIDGLNTYCFMRANPVTLSDPQGTKSKYSTPHPNISPAEKKQLERWLQGASPHETPVMPPGQDKHKGGGDYVMSHLVPCKLGFGRTDSKVHSKSKDNPDIDDRDPSGKDPAKHALGRFGINTDYSCVKVLKAEDNMFFTGKGKMDDKWDEWLESSAVNYFDDAFDDYNKAKKASDKKKIAYAVLTHVWNQAREFLAELSDEHGSGLSGPDVAKDILSRMNHHSQSDHTLPYAINENGMELQEQLARQTNATDELTQEVIRKGTKRKISFISDPKYKVAPGLAEPLNRINDTFDDMDKLMFSMGVVAPGAKGKTPTKGKKGKKPPPPPKTVTISTADLAKLHALLQSARANIKEFEF